MEAQTEGADRTVTPIAFIHRSCPLPSTAFSRCRSSLNLSGDVATVYHLRFAKLGAVSLSRIISSIIPSAKKISLFTCAFASAFSRAGPSPPPHTRLICHRDTSTNAITRLRRALPGHIGLRSGKLAMVTTAPCEIARWSGVCAFRRCERRTRGVMSRMRLEFFCFWRQEMVLPYNPISNFYVGQEE